MLLGGRAGDIFGRRRMLVVGLAVFTASSLVGGLATSSGMLIAARAVQGVGAAMAAPSTLVLIAATFAEGRLAWLSQTSVSQGYLGGIFGPLMLFGLGAGTCFLPLSATILTGVARDDSGSASGMLQAMQQIGGSVGLAVLVSVAAGHGQGAALAVAATFTAVALVLAVVATTRRTPVAVPARAMAE